MGHEAHVRAQGDEIETGLEAADGEVEAAGVNPGRNTVGLAGGENPLDGGQVDGIVGVTQGRKAERKGQVGRTDIDATQSGGGHDGIDVVDAFSGFDHHDAGDLFVGFGGIAHPAVESSPDRAERAAAQGRITAGRDGGLGLGPVVHQGNDDPHGPGVQHLHDVSRIVAGHPYERGGLGGGDGRQHVTEVRVVEKTVLEIDTNPVEAGVGQHLGGVGVGQR